MATQEDFRIDGRTAVITGAGRGIGKSIALTLAEGGADIVAIARSRDEIEAVAEEIRGLGKRALAIAADVTREEEVQAAIARVIGEFGRIDVLVNNAGDTVLGAVALTEGDTRPAGRPLGPEVWDRRQAT